MTTKQRTVTNQTDVAALEATIVEYLVANYAPGFTVETLPREAPPLELQIVDSFGFMDLIAFVEATWGVSFAQSEQTADRLGSARCERWQRRWRNKRFGGEPSA